MVNIVPAFQSDQSTLEAFFGIHWGKQLYKRDLYNFGKYIEIEGERLGFFALIPCEDGESWLRTLYFKENFNPALMMLGIDWIKNTAFESGFRRIYAFSHSSSTDTLFQTWGFEKLMEQPRSIVDKVEKPGTWWALKTYLSRTNGQ